MAKNHKHCSSIHEDLVLGFPLIFKHLSKKDVIECRKVSPELRQSVDLVLDNLGRNVPSANLSLFPKLSICTPTLGTDYEEFELYHFPRWDDFGKGFAVDLFSTVQMTKLWDHLENSKKSGHTSAIPSKRVNLVIPNIDEAGYWRQNCQEKPNFINEALVPLDNQVLPSVILDYVIDIWNHYPGFIVYLDAQISINADEGIFQEIFNCLCKLVSLPSLESLCMVCNIRNLSRQKLNKNENMGISVPSSIKNLHMYISTEMPLCFYLSILEMYGGQLMSWTFGDVMMETNIIEYFPRLAHLKTTNLSSLRCSFDWKYYYLLAFISAPKLVELNLRDMAEHTFPLTELRCIVMNFPNLKVLQIGPASPNASYIDQDLSANADKHPHLKKIILVGGKRQIPLKYFASMSQNLRVLHVVSELDSSEGTSKDEDYWFLCNGNIKAMSIWNVCITLEVLHHTVENDGGKTMFRFSKPRDNLELQ